MGRSRATMTRAGKGKAAASACASEAAGGSTTLKRKAAASASEAAGGSGLKRKTSTSTEERKILRLKKEEDRKILRLKKEEDRKIRRVKSEEGKILKLKKEYTAAEDDAMANLPAAYRPTSPVKAADPAGEKRKKTVLVKRLVPQEQIDALLALPSSIIPDELTEEELAKYSKSFRDFHNQEANIFKKLRNYHQALVDQYFKYGYAVDESEAEVTDDEGEDNNSC